VKPAPVPMPVGGKTHIHCCTRARLALEQERFKLRQASFDRWVGAQLMALNRCRMAVIAVAVGVFAASFGAGAAPFRMLSDKKPNKGVSEAHSMPVQGIDVSYWQGDIDWQKV